MDDVYSGGKPDGKHPLLSEAMAAGFLHPRCKDSVETFFPWEDEPEPNPLEGEELAEAEAAEAEEAKQQNAERMAERWSRRAKYQNDPGNRRMAKAHATEWREDAASYKYPIDEGQFTTYARPRDDGRQIDIIRPHNIMKDMRKSSYGRRALKHIEDHDIPVRMCYNVDNPLGLKGYYDPVDKVIVVFADEADSVADAAKTVIHEATHARLGGSNSQRQEVMCFVEEILHEKGSLTYRELRNIIKHVKSAKTYADLSWR